MQALIRGVSMQALIRGVSMQALIEVLQLKPALANCYNAHMEAPIHAILRKKKKWRLNLLVTLLSHSLADVNLPTQSTGHTPLHIAMMVCMCECV